MNQIRSVVFARTTCAACLAALFTLSPLLQADPPPGTGSWTLTLDENFNGTTLNTAIWTAGPRHASIINNEIQAYRPENVSVQDGYLRITASKIAGRINHSGGYGTGATVINVDGFNVPIPAGSKVRLLPSTGDSQEGLYDVVSSQGGSTPTQITLATGLRKAYSDNDEVILTAKNYSMGGHEYYNMNYRSGLIQTYNKWTQAYGYFEARMKMSSATGTWPAFWLLPDRGPSYSLYPRTAMGTWTNNGTPDNPADDVYGLAPGYEIDILEYFASWKGKAGPNLASGHSGIIWDYNPPSGTKGAISTYTMHRKLPNPDTEYHTYGLYWGPGVLRFYIDGREVFSHPYPYTSYVPECPHYLIINMAMAVNDWTNSHPTLAQIDAALPGYLDVDWVRVWSGSSGAGESSGDIGAVGTAGSHSFASSLTTVHGAGAGITGTADAFHFVGQELKGNGTITVKVNSLTGSSSNRRAGLMMRERADLVGSRNVFVGKTSTGSSVFTRRTSENGSTTSTSSSETGSWIRLVRNGTTITAFVSSNGTSWTQIGSQSISNLADTLVVGPAVTSGTTTSLATAAFEGFKVTPAFEGADVIDDWKTLTFTGSTSVTSGTYTVAGAGKGFAYEKDEGHFAGQKITGDFCFTARVVSVTGGSQWQAATGIMMREDREQEGRNVFLAHTPTGKFFNYRGEHAGSTTGSGTFGAGGRMWHRIIRTGNTITGYLSSDGVNWDNVGSATLTDLPETVLVGLATAAKDTSQIAVGILDTVSFADWPATTTPVNLALQATVSAYSSQQSGNEAVKIKDGDTSDSHRWAASGAGYPQYVELDLGADRQITSTEVYMYKSRAYQFRIEARSESGSYQTIVNQESNTQGGPFIDTFAPVTARYVKITVTGDHNVSTDWANINELKIMGTTSAPPSGPVNLALQSTVSSSSSQQSGNEAVKIKDDDTTDNQRWSASSSSYPQYVELDLGADRQFTSTEVYPYKNRAYQFRIEARTASGSYQTIVNRQSNTQTGPFIDTFSPVTARYVKITVTGCYNSSSAWATINELKVIGNP